jgi:hypothetical protein
VVSPLRREVCSLAVGSIGAIPSSTSHQQRSTNHTDHSISAHIAHRGEARDRHECALSRAAPPQLRSAYTTCTAVDVQPHVFGVFDGVFAAYEGRRAERQWRGAVRDVAVSASAQPGITARTYGRPDSQSER